MVCSDSSAPSLPLSMDEIRSFGLNLDRDFMTQPFINDKVLEEVFGAQSEYVRQRFVTPNGKGGYALLPEFDTQRKVKLISMEKKTKIA